VRRPRRWLIGIFCVAAVAAAAYAGHDRLLPLAARWLDVSDTPRPTDYAMVLPGEQNVRPFVAAALVRTGYAREVLVPTNKTAPKVDEGIRPPIHEVIRRVLQYRGVPPEAILILDAKTSGTFSDVQALADFLEKAPGASVSVVTSDYHTRRTRLALAQVLGDRLARVTLVSAPTEKFTDQNWWKCSEGFIAIAGEHLKLAYYVSRYTRVPYWSAACAGAVFALLVWRRRRNRRLGRPISTPI